MLPVSDQVPATSTKPLRNGGFTQREMLNIFVGLMVLFFLATASFSGQANKDLAKAVFNRASQQQLAYKQTGKYSATANQAKVAAGKSLDTRVQLQNASREAILTFPSYPKIKVVLQQGNLQSCQANKKEVCKKFSKDFASIASADRRQASTR